MTWNLSKVMRALGKCSLTPLMKAGDMSMLTLAICWGSALCSLRNWLSSATVLASRPSGNQNHFARLGIGGKG